MSLTASKTNRTIKTYEYTLWVLFVVWPVVSFFFAVKNFHIKRYRKFIILFGVLYGLTYIPIPGSDGSRYAQRFEETGIYTVDQYIDDITHIYAGATQPDVYAHTLIFSLSKFSDNAQFFHMVTALIYFLVFIKLLASIYNIGQGVWGKYYLWFFLGCVFILNFSSGINGVRFPLAFMVFSLGAFKLIVTGKKYYLVIALLSPFIHYMFIYPVIFLLIFQWVPFSRNQTFLLVFLLLSLLAGTLFHTFIQSNIGFLGESYESRYTGYTSEAWIEGRNEHVATQWNWYVVFRFFGTYYFPLIAMFLVWLMQKKFHFNDISKKLFAFAVLMIIASFISGGMVDMLSNRYNALAIIFSLIFLFYISSINPKSLMLKTLSRFYIPVFIINALVTFRADLYTVSPWLIFGNPVIMWFHETTVSIQELILG